MSPRLDLCWNMPYFESPLSKLGVFWIRRGRGVTTLHDMLFKMLLAVNDCFFVLWKKRWHFVLLEQATVWQEALLTEMLLHWQPKKKHTPEMWSVWWDKIDLCYQHFAIIWVRLHCFLHLVVLTADSVSMVCFKRDSIMTAINLQTGFNIDKRKCLFNQSNMLIWCSRNIYFLLMFCYWC